MNKVEEIISKIYEEGEDTYSHKMKNKNGYKHFRNKKQCIQVAFFRAIKSGQLWIPKTQKELEEIMDNIEPLLITKHYASAIIAKMKGEREIG